MQKDKKKVFFVKRKLDEMGFGFEIEKLVETLW
jgi:hypothetical protein